MLDTSSMPNDAKYELQDLFEELNGENDRAAAIVGAAWMDDILLEILKGFLVSSKEATRLLGDGGIGPVSSLSARSKLAFSLGLISKEQLRNLDIVRKVRNLFAHRIHRSTFDNAKIQSHCQNLTLGKRVVSNPVEASARELFIATVAILAYSFGIEKKRVSAHGLEEKIPVSIEDQIKS